MIITEGLTQRSQLERCIGNGRTYLMKFYEAGETQPRSAIGEIKEIDSDFVMLEGERGEIHVRISNVVFWKPISYRLEERQ